MDHINPITISSSNKFKHTPNLHTVFWFIALLQLSMWTILPVFIRHSIGNDLIEALSWGRQFQWGYDKNPLLPGLIANIGGLLGHSAWGIYFLQQLFILIGIWSVKSLTFELTNNHAYAFISATVLLLCASYNIEVQIYNDNYILQGLLPLSAFFFYRALKNNDLKQWLLSATFLGLATLAKYSAIIYLPIYGFYLLLLLLKGKNHYFSIKPYLALLLYCVILLPNFIWLYHQDFNALNYAFSTRGALRKLTYGEYLGNNLHFLLTLLIQSLPAVIGLLFAIEFRKNLRENERQVSPAKLANDASLFNCLIAFAPIILLFIVASLLGFSLHREWGSTFISFIGTGFLIIFQPTVSNYSLKRFIIFIIVIMLGFAIGYIVVSKKNATGTYPGPEIAKFATNWWRSHYKTKLMYVAGDRYTASYIGYYSPDKPLVWMEWDQRNSPWINQQRLRCKGALFVIESGHTVQHFFKGSDFPAFVRKQFPQLKNLPIKIFNWRGSQSQPLPVRVRFAILPPDKTFCN